MDVGFSDSFNAITVRLCVIRWTRKIILDQRGKCLGYR